MNFNIHFFYKKSFQDDSIKANYQNSNNSIDLSNTLIDINKLNEQERLKLISISFLTLISSELIHSNLNGSNNKILNNHAKAFKTKIIRFVIKNVMMYCLKIKKDIANNTGFRYVHRFMKTYEQSKKDYHMYIIIE